MRTFEMMDLIDEKYLDEVFEDRKIMPVFVRMGINAVAIAAVFVLAFTGMVNLFPATAYAMNDMIFLGDLAKAVTMDQSMRACLDNEYAQYVGKKKTTEDGYTSKVYYMVTDASKVSIFFHSDVSMSVEESAEDKSKKNVIFTAEATFENDECVTSLAGTDTEELYEFQIELIDSKVPEKIDFTICYYDAKDADNEAAVPISEVTYQLYPDKKYATVMESYEINQVVEAEGQKITLEKLEIYPTQAKLFLHEDKKNTVKLEDISIVLIDDKNRKYERKANGLTASYDEADNLAQMYYESSYFSETKKLVLRIDGIRMIPEEQRYGIISLENQSMGNTPDGVHISEMKRKKNGSLAIELEVREQEKNAHFNPVEVVYAADYSPVYIKSTRMTTISLTSDMGLEKEGYFYVGFDIPEYEDGKYAVEWQYADMVKLDEEIEVEIK